MRRLFIGGAIAAFALSPAIAETVAPGQHAWRNRVETRAELQADVAKMFARMDSNKDGVVTVAEIESRQVERAGRKQAKMAKMAMRAEHRDPAKVFARLDANKDGKLVKAEVEAAMAARAQAKGKAPHGAERLFAMADANKDGAITLAEMQAMPKPGLAKHGMKPGQAANGAMKGGMKVHMFGQADLDKDGKVTLAEAQRAAIVHFERADANRDGKVTPDERKAMRQAMRTPNKG